MNRLIPLALLAAFGTACIGPSGEPDDSVGLLAERNVPWQQDAVETTLEEARARAPFEVRFPTYWPEPNRVRHVITNRAEARSDDVKVGVLYEDGTGLTWSVREETPPFAEAPDLFEGATTVADYPAFVSQARDEPRTDTYRDVTIIFRTGLAWWDGGVLYRVISAYPPEEAIKVAESMMT